MSQHLVAQYKRNSRKRIKEQCTEEQPAKTPKTDAERARCYRANKKAARVEASPTVGWDAGEGPSTRGRKFPTICLHDTFHIMNLIIIIDLCY